MELSLFKMVVLSRGSDLTPDDEFRVISSNVGYFVFAVVWCVASGVTGGERKNRFMGLGPIPGGEELG